MKIALASGGTAGHIYPALALAQELRQQGHDVFFIGVFRDTGELIRKLGFEYMEISARGLYAQSMSSIFVTTVFMFKATIESIKMLSHYKPERVIGFGGYGAFPVVLSGFLLRIPTAIHEQNVLPGRANRFLKFLVNRIFISFQKSIKYFPAHKVVWTGYPTLRKFKDFSKVDIAQEWALDPYKKTILVIGGSQGSHAINEIFLDTMDLLKSSFSYQVVHSTGENDFPYVKKRYEDNNVQHYIMPFIDDMAKAYSLADVVISRAGAGAITEIAAYHKPCILIPYPHAQQHQQQNAALLAAGNNALVLNEKEMYPEQLRDAIMQLLEDFSMDPYGLNILKELFVLDADLRLAKEVLAIKG